MRRQLILCCDPSAALGCARPEVRLVLVGTSETLADCLTTTVDTKFGPSLETRIGDQIQS